MTDPDYDVVVSRINEIYNSSTKQEQQMLKQILGELAHSGYSYTYEQIFLNDFKEVPVSIDEFICNSYYMGSTNSEGAQVYPFWKQTFRNIFNAGNKYNEILFSGATRLGKSSSMVTILCYMLYKLMLYRNPHEYFNKKEVSRFTIAFANLTKDLAYGVAYREYQDTIKDIPWFNEHGRFSRSDRNFYYMPEGDKIDIIAGSDASNFLGMQIWCLKGSTNILTIDGVRTIEECSGSQCTVIQYVNDCLVPTKADIQCTGYVTELIKIELEDGTIIEGTPDHEIMLSDGSYKCLGDLTSSDDLLTFNIAEEVDDMYLKDPEALFIVYEHVSPKGKRYVGITSKSPEERWQKGGKAYVTNSHFWNAIQKYGWENFQHNILATRLTLQEACSMEVELIAKYDLMNPNKGYNHTTGGNWSTPDEETRQKLSIAIKQSRTPEVLRKISDALKGHEVSDITRQKISEANKGMQISEKERERRRNYRHSPEAIEKMRNQPGWCKGLTKETDPRLAKLSEMMKQREFKQEWKDKLSAVRKAQYQNGYKPRWINNGTIETSIQADDPLPDGFVYGRLRNKDVYIHKGELSKKISHSDLDKYLADGWVKGRPESVKTSIRKSLQTMHWEYDGIRFERASDLTHYLNEHGYPDIVDSTVTSLYVKGFHKSTKYKSLDGKIKKVLHEDKID